MIDIINLKLKYKDYLALKNINLHLPSTGLVTLLGPSGCGKTSLFNCLSGLLKYQGEIIYDGIYLNRLKEEEMNKFRLENIGFIFQDFKLFNLDTVIHNVAFPFDVLNGYSSSRNTRRLLDLLELVGLAHKENEVVKNLSGGEKQRIAIARALVNNPSIILADEPTGALDEENAVKIMELLKDISKDKLVIVVSHDQDLMEKYVDLAIFLNDGKVVNQKKYLRDEKKNDVNLINSEFSKKKPSIPLRFLSRHTFSHIKERKWRTTLISFVTSLGLIGVGLATCLSYSISSNIKKACASIMNENQIMISSNNKNELLTLVGRNYEDALDIKNDYKEYIDDVGVIYQTNFSKHFKDQDEFYLLDNNNTLKISNYSARHINEFEWLDEVDRDFYPYRPETLDNDELVIKLPLGTVYDICFQLRILRTVDALAEYIQNNDLFIIHKAKNNDWEYEDEQIYKIRAFTLDYELGFYHYNHKWNEHVFETEMRFPSSLNMSAKSTYPWTMKKLNYLSMNSLESKDTFLSNIRYNDKYRNYLFEIGTSNYFPLSIKYDDNVKDVSKVLVLKNTLNTMPSSLVDKVLDTIDQCESPIIGTKGGYAIYDEAMMMGFSRYTYFSFDYDLLNNTLEEYAHMPTLNNQKLSNMDNIMIGHFSQSMQNGVIFQQIPEIYQKDVNIASLDEIVISSGLLNSFNTKNKDVLHLAFTINEERMPNGNVVREFHFVPLKVKAIIPDERKIIYHNRDWTIDFFQSRIGVSIFDLGINTICFDVKDESKFEDTLSLMKKAFPDYKVINPMSSLNEGIDEVCFYLEIVMYIFSIVSVVISIFLLSICNYLHILEIRRDIGLSRCIGVSKIESTKFIFIHAYIMAFISFLVSSFELLIINAFISKVIANYLEVGFEFSINPFSFVYMFLLAFLISTFSSIIIAFKVVKFSPLDSLKVG